MPDPVDPQAPPRPPNAAWSWRWPLQLLAVLLVAGAVFWPLLGDSGFSFSEGPRVLPGWEMARHGDWLMPHLFGQPYLRKPPGMPWAIGLFSMALGESEFSARAVSALAMTIGAVLAWLFARRWFGDPWGLVAGIGFSLTPLFWYPGRSAEIEALHALFSLLAMLTATEVLAPLQRPRPAAAAAWSGALALSITAMAIVKGPAGMPCLAGVMAGVCITTRSRRPLFNPYFWAGLLTGALLIAGFAWALLVRVRALPELPVTQSLEQFLWKPGKVLEVIFLLPLFLLAALPCAAGLLLVLPRPPGGRQKTPRDTVGRSLAWTVIATLLLYTIIGVSKNRYAMPIATILPLVLAYGHARLHDRLLPPKVLRVARLLLMDRPVLWLGAMLIGSSVLLIANNHRRATVTTGQFAGERLADFLPDGAEVWADDLLDNRPEIGYYAQLRAAELGKTLIVRWMPHGKNNLGDNPMPPPGVYLALLESGKDEDPVAELDRYRAAGVMDRLEEVGQDFAHKFIFRMYRVLPYPARFAESLPDNPPS